MSDKSERAVLPPTMRSPRARAVQGRNLLTALVAALVLAGCAVQLIADYDQHTFERTAELQEDVERLFATLEDAAATPDPEDDLYPAHAESYNRLVGTIRALEVRAQTLDRNQIPAEQIDLLRKSIESIQSEHREFSQRAVPKGFSAEALKILREPISQQFRAIFTLQEALKR